MSDSRSLLPRRLSTSRASDELVSYASFIVDLNMTAFLARKELCYLGQRHVDRSVSS